MTERALIGVLIAAFNAADTIARAVRSALIQPQVSEVIVVDDKSTDGTPELALAAASGDPRFRLTQSQVNGGPAQARNKAMEMATAELLCVLDSDDWWEPDRLARLLRIEGDWDMLADDLLLVDEAISSDMRKPLLNTQRYEFMDGPGFVLSNISHRDRPRQEFGFLKPLMRRDFLLRNKLRYDTLLRLGEDFAFYTEALIAGARWLNVPACGYVAVRRRASLSHCHGALELTALAAADARLVIKAHDKAPLMVRPLQRHRHHVLLERNYRQMLDAKAQGKWLSAAAHALRSPATTTYIGQELFRTKLRLGRRAFLPDQDGP